MLGLWRFDTEPRNFWLIPIQAAMVIIPAFIALPLARLIGCSRDHACVVALLSALSNTGTTLGAYLCYVYIQPHAQALAFGVAMVNLSQLTAVLVLFPVARHYSPEQQAAVPLGRLMLRNFTDIRAMGFYGAIAGLALAIFKVPFPAVIDDWRLIDALSSFSAFGSYFGIGLLLRLDRVVTHLQEHILVAAMKFIVTPVLTLLMLLAIQRTHAPLGDTAWQVVMVQSAMPTGILAVMIANLFRLDAQMASVSWVVNTLVFSVVVLPVLLTLMRV